MKPASDQRPLFNEPYEIGSPAATWATDATKYALDDLFNATFAYRSSNEFYELVKFVRRFRFYSPYNAFLIHTQRPGARFVAPSSRWQKCYGRRVKPNANPIVILQPMGPVMFVFDVSDTEPGPHPRPLPKDVEKPFEPRKGKIGNEFDRTIENAKRDGIRIHSHQTGSQRGGSIQSVFKPDLAPLLFKTGKDRQGNPIYHQIPVRYELLLSRKLSRESRYAILVHELAHLYCGHLGTANRKWWPGRLGLSHQTVEFEAESVAYLVCERIGIDNPSATYLAGYVKTRDKVPRISLECVMKSAGLIERMGKNRLKLRKITEE